LHFAANWLRRTAQCVVRPVCCDLLACTPETSLAAKRLTDKHQQQGSKHVSMNALLVRRPDFRGKTTDPAF
jgi:hypothetical protein